MSEFKRLKSELFQGGEKELREVIEFMRNITATPVEREFDPKWAVELRGRILAGRAIPFHWVVAQMSQGGKIIHLRENGQHSSWAMADLLKSRELPNDLAVYMTTYSLSDKEAAVMLFRQFDDRRSSRSKEDISGAYQCFQDPLRHCSRKVLRIAAEGVNFYRRDVIKDKDDPILSGDEVYTLFDEKRLHPFYMLAHDLLGTGKANELLRTPIMGAMFGSWLENAKAAEEFWGLVTAGSGRTEEDAATDLDLEILRIREQKERVNPREMYLKCVKAWDAYDKGIRVTNFRVDYKKGLPALGQPKD